MTRRWMMWCLAAGAALAAGIVVHATDLRAMAGVRTSTALRVLSALRGQAPGAHSRPFRDLRVLSGLRGDNAPRAQESPRLPAADERVPVVVELFTSEGCSSCPPADTLLRELVATQPVPAADIIGLGEHVDYWDHLGWRDRFSSPLFTNRQRIYGDALRVESIYTPQLVVDGRAELVGSNRRAAAQAIARAAAAPHGRVEVSIEPVRPDAISVAIVVNGLPPPSKGDRDEAVVAITEEHLTSDVRRGENRGRTLTHEAVVRSLTKAGDVAGGVDSAHFAVPTIALGADWNRARLNVVAFVQESRSRRIVGAATTPIPAAR